MIELFETSLRNEAVGRILGKGYSPADYTLLCYGGGGPLHVAGYTNGVPYQQVLVPEWAAGFSAFGCACADFEYRFDRQVDLPLLPNQPAAEQVQMGGLLTQAWRSLEDRVRDEFAKSGYSAEDVSFTHMVRMQYYGQLVDIEVDAPKPAIESERGVRDLIEAFETTYTRMYARAASSPELGYLVAQAIVKGSVPIEQPTLPAMPRESGSPPVKETREVWWHDGYVEHRRLRDGRRPQRPLDRGPRGARGRVHDLPDPARPPSLARRARHLPPGVEVKMTATRMRSTDTARIRPFRGVPRSAATREPCDGRPAWSSTSPNSRSSSLQLPNKEA